MDQPLLNLPQVAPTRRRGRPPGARNKRSIDLARYIEATMAGMTPGQQSAQLAMVTPRDLREAKHLALELMIPEISGASPMLLAMAVKAKQLARAIGCEAKEAWLLLQKEREGLMPYVHQRQAQAAESKVKPPATVFLIPEGEAGQAQLADFSADDQDELEIVGDFDAPADQVGQPKSDDAT